VTNVDSNRSIVLDFFDTYVTLFSHGGGNLGFEIYTKFLKWEKVTVFHIGTNLTKDHSLIVYNKSNIRKVFTFLLNSMDVICSKNGFLISIKKNFGGFSKN
jgi:hypothetical protein